MKAISMFSGGLDSQLAVCLMQDQGIEVIGVTITTPFFGMSDTIQKAAEQLHIELHTLYCSEEYMDVLLEPVYGYGKHMNPCIDCHAFMQRKAYEFMQETGASFLISGEVLGQRPMSQTRSSLNAVDKLAGVNGLMLRPLSALLLPPTIPEEKGWVDRSRLLDINGRSRTRQIQLAEKYNLIDYPTPAGGCLLTQENFARRLRSYLENRSLIQADELTILRYGRQFYTREGNLILIGRNQAENMQLNQLAQPQDYLLKVTERPGPLGLLRPMNSDSASMKEIDFAARLTARYSDAKKEPSTRVMVKRAVGESSHIIEVKPMDEKSVPPSV
ncbi:MAG TPA: tRNA 4-thiouridine(8) synthase ThiI [Syntrophomonadaceae bacterium]|nr:tRNA 4-thiouridine(8) synthase ThiI [Syntrophomonadaceae bacterium]